jgi:hypothetical protein
MQKPFDALYAKLETSLNSLDRGLAPVDRYAQGIALIRAAILEMQAAGRKYLAGRGPEVVYFRQVWPLFYGKLFLYIRVHRFELVHFSLAVDNLDALIAREDRRVAAFFRANREFWMYFKSGLVGLDEQFTREWSRARIFDPLAAVIDPESATVGSYRAAWCLAYEGYATFLRREEQRISAPGARDSGQRYEWKESKTAAVELIKSQAEAGSIHINGKPATAAQLKVDFEERYGEDLKDFDLLLYQTDARKKEPTPYLTKLANAFVGRKLRLRK